MNETKSPYHDGELRVQRRAGESDSGLRNGRIVSDRIPKAGVRFLAQQQMLVVGSVDRHGDPWASVIMGDAGFATSDAAGRRVAVHLGSVVRSDADVLWVNVATDRRVGLLAIELTSRRRLRINGDITTRNNALLEFTVTEAYPNCPKYIQRRHLRAVQASDAAAAEAEHSDRLSPADQALVRATDTVFVASVNGRYGVDASHRGGAPGFVSIVDERELRIPDYPGNSMFNTFGNLENHPRIGLTICDFDSSSVLQIVGAAQVQFEQNDPDGTTGGTGRFLSVNLDKTRRWSLGVHAEWEYLDASPFNPVGPQPSREGDNG